MPRCKRGVRASQAPRPRPPGQIARSGAKRIAAHIQNNVGRQHLTSAHGPFASPSQQQPSLCAPSSRLSQFSCRHASACDGARTGCPPLTRSAPPLHHHGQHATFLRLCASNMNRRLEKAKAAKTIPRIAAPRFTWQPLHNTARMQPRREPRTRPRAHYAPKCPNAAVAFASPCAAARRYHRMASALFILTP